MELTRKKPAIYVRTLELGAPILMQILYGMEEEGIPFELKEIESTDVLYESHQAAKESPLLVGVAYLNDQVVIHYRSLPRDYPVFNEARLASKDKQFLRALGANAARLVKGIPFKLV